MRKIYAVLVGTAVVGGVVLGTSFGQAPNEPRVIASNEPKSEASKIPSLELPPLGQSPGEQKLELPQIPQDESKLKLEMPPLEPMRTEERKVEVPMPAPKLREIPMLPIEETPKSEKPEPAVETAKVESKKEIKETKKLVAASQPGEPVPSVSVKAIAPEEIGLGQTLIYEIVVKNVGNCFVQQVRLEDELPTGTKYIASDPTAEVLGDRLQWALGGLEIEGVRRIKVQVKPNNEAEFHTKPTVTYSTQATMQVRITRPKLQLEIAAAEMASVGDDVVFDIKVTNVGNGVAQKILLEAAPTAGLSHPELQQSNKKVVTAEIGPVQPGESRTVKLRTQAVAVGQHYCSVTATALGADASTAVANVQIHQPSLQMKMIHPKRCLVKGEPTFQLELVSSGTIATPPVQMAAAFPEGLEFISATDNGVYDPVTKTINWSLAAQAAGAKKTITIKARATAAGNLAVRAVAQAGTKIDTRAEGVIAVEGIPALSFDLVETANPVEVGKETTYEIKIANQGTCNCTNVRVIAALSEGLTVTAVAATVPYKIQGQNLIFDPLPRLAMKGEQIIRVKVKGTKAGDQRFKAQLECDQIKRPVVKEESTSIYQP